MYDVTKHPYLRKLVVLLMAFVMVVTYFPMQTFAASGEWTHAYFRNGSVLEGSDGKPYYNDSRRYSNRWYTTKWNIDDNCYAQQGPRHAYSLKNKRTGQTYRAYCLEQDVKNPNSGNTLYSAEQMENISFLKQLTKEQKKGIEFALLYGKQPDVSTSDMVKLLGDAVKGCNADDWYVATQAIIWEFQQNLRSSVSGIPKNVTVANVGTKPWRNTPADFFYKPIKNRPAGVVYRNMLRAMRLHKEVPSFTKDRKDRAPYIHMEKVGNEYWSVNKKYANLSEEEKEAARANADYYYLEDTKDIPHQLKVMNGKKKSNKFVFEKKKGGKHPQYKLIYKGADLPTGVQHGKKDIKEATKLDCLAWNVTDGHYQTLAFGADDPVDFYFKLKTKAEPEEPTEGNEKPEPEFFPEFTWPVHKDDVNPGWDGDHCTGMGDASLGSTFVLKRDGEVVDEITLDDLGSTDYLSDQPWVNPEDIPSVDSGSYTHTEGDPPSTHCTVQPTRCDWDDEVTYTIEEITPDGRHPAEFDTTKDLPGNTTVRGTYKVKYHCETVNNQTCVDNPEDWTPMNYDITITDADGTETHLTGQMGEGDIQYEFTHEFNEQVWINDNYRGDLQIVKTKDDQDPFTDKTNSDNGIKDYSTKSKWTIQLKSGGWEDHPYIRVEDEGVKEAAAGEYERYAHVYRVVRDTSGYTADETHPLEVSKDGQIYVYDLPYGTYIVNEISADSEGYVLESFEVVVNEHGQKISKAVNNQPKKNKIKVVKTNSETGKTVRWDADRTAFRIRYKGNPDLNDPTVSPNYNKYLPNGSSYTDNADSNYVFYANKNGEIVLPYQIEYGIYEIEELIVPKGYFVGQYDKKGNGSIADMGAVDIIDHKGQTVKPPKTFLEAVQVRDEEGNKVTEFKGDNKTTYNTYRFTVKEQDPHEDGTDYVTYYAIVDMPNIPAKGKIEISKTGEGLVGWKEGSDGGYSIWKAIWDKITLKDTKFEIYAAKDIVQSDGVVPIEAYFAADDSKVELTRTSRDHADASDAKEVWEKAFDNGATILQVKDKGLIKDFGKANATVTDYKIKALNGATFENTYRVRDDETKMTYEYTVSYKLNYSKGGFNYTDIHVTKKSTADDYVAEIAVTDPILKSGELELGFVTMNYDGGNMVRMNPLAEEGNVTEEEDIKGVHSAYNKDDITAKPVDPDAPEYQKQPVIDEETGEQKLDENGEPMFTEPEEVVRPEGFIDVKDEDGKYTYEDRVDADQNTLPKFFQVTDGAGNYQIYIKEGDAKRWVSCDKDGNFYKSYFQEYNFTTAQHYQCPDGFTFTWDSVIDLSAAADNDAETTTTIIKEPEGAADPKITETEGIYSHVTENGVTTFTGTPNDKALVYFLTHDGIRTEMYLSGGLAFTRITVLQSQLFAFDTVLPQVTHNGNDINWHKQFEKDFDPAKDTFEYIADDRNYVKAVRHEASPENKEVYFTIDIVTNNTDYDKGFKVTYPDTTTAVPMVTDGGEGADLRFASIDDTMVYPIGKPVEVITTNLKGIAESSPLPLGEYWVREVSSAAGHVNKGQWQKMILEYKDQYTPLVWDTGKYENDAVSVKIDLEKLFETKYESGEYVPGDGAVFGIYTAEEIKGTTKSDKKVDKKAIPSDTLVGKMVVSGGHADATIKLPQGKYYIKEISAPEGFKLNGTKYYFDAVDVLTADTMNFHYKDIGVSGFVTQDGENGPKLDFDTLYRYNTAKVNIDGKDYSLDTASSEEGSNVSVAVLDGRTNTQVKIKSGQTTTVRFENGAVLTLKADGQTYTAELTGPAPTKLETGAEGNENFTKVTEGGKTIIKYQPKVTKTNWLSEVVYKYVKPADAGKPGDLIPIQPANKVLALTSPEGTSEVTASVDYEFGSAQLNFYKGTVNSITVDDEAVTDTDSVTLKRIKRTPVMVEDPDNPGQQIQKVDKDGNPIFDTKVKATKAVINFADGVTFTVQFDAAGNFYIDASGSVDKNLETESILMVDGSDKLPKGITLKNTTAKTYARNNTYAGVLNITVNNVKNDRVPEEPPTPPGPGPSPSEPYIKTLAKDSVTLDHISKADGKVTIIDTVTYSNLVAGKEYTVKGVLMDKETGKPVTVKGKAVTAEKVFTPEKSSGTVDMKFTFDGSSLEGKTTVVFEEIYLNVDTDKDGKPDTPEEKPTATHKDLSDGGQTVYFPEIGTTAADSETDTHISNPDKKVTIKDVVKYENLIPGKEYTVSGVLMDKATGKPLLIDGKKITAEKTFIADAASGSVTLEFTFDGRALEGKTIVVFEKLKYNRKEVAVHEDIKDKDQSVRFPEIGTTAADSDTGKHVSKPDSKVTIIDKVKFENLIPGKEYTVKGVLMDKETGKPLVIDGKKVTAEKTFIADSANGSVELKFTFDGSSLKGKEVVVFEKMYYDGELIASHEDIKDKGQTVKLTDKAGELEIETPGGSDGDDGGEVTVGPQTGDSSNLILWSALLLIALAALSLLLAHKRQHAAATVDRIDKSDVEKAMEILQEEENK